MWKGLRSKHLRTAGLEKKTPTIGWLHDVKVEGRYVLKLEKIWEERKVAFKQLEGWHEGKSRYFKLQWVDLGSGWRISPHYATFLKKKMTESALSHIDAEIEAKRRDVSWGDRGRSKAKMRNQLSRFVAHNPMCWEVTCKEHLSDPMPHCCHAHSHIWDALGPVGVHLFVHSLKESGKLRVLPRVFKLISKTSGILQTLTF